MAKPQTVVEQIRTAVGESPQPKPIRVPRTAEQLAERHGAVPSTLLSGDRMDAYVSLSFRDLLRVIQAGIDEGRQQ